MAHGSVRKEWIYEPVLLLKKYYYNLNIANTDNKDYATDNESVYKVVPESGLYRATRIILTDQDKE